MKTIIGVLLTLLAVPLLFAADEKPWPQKGDTVYVSVSLPSISQPAFLGTKNSDLRDLNACSPLTVEKFQDGLVVARDDSGGDRRLEGDWTARIHRLVDECRTARDAAPARAKIERHAIRSGIFGYVLATDSHQAPSN